MKFMLDLPESLHKDIKIQSARDGESMNEIINKAIETYLKVENKEVEDRGQ